MAGEYGVNIKFKTIGLSQLDKAKAKARELEASVSRIRSLDLSKAIRGKVGDQVAEATSQIKRYAQQVNKTGKVIGQTQQQQEAALQAFKDLRSQVKVGGRDFDILTEAIIRQNKAIDEQNKKLGINQKKRKADPQRSNASALKSGLVSGAFPLLFGQGPIGGIAGFTGGFAGTKIGGQMGGFAGGLVATAITQQLTEAIKGLNDLGKALDPKTLNIDTVSKSLGLLGTDTERYLKLIEQTQGKQAAYNAVVEETRKLVGEDGVEALKAFADSSQNLTNEMSKFFTRLGSEIAKLFQRGADQDTDKRIIGFERSNLLAQAKEETEDKEIMDLVKQRENANRNIARQLDDQIVKLMKAKNAEDARKKAAELARMEYEQITKSLTDQITFLENSISLGSSEAEIIREKTKLIEAARKAGVKFDEDEIDRQVRLKTELQRTKQLYDGIANSIQGGLVDAIEGAINGTKTLGDVARSVFGAIQRQLINFAATSFLKAIPGIGGFFANGGVTKPNKSYIVGERGPELFTPGVTGRVTPNHEMMGGGSTSVVVNVDASGSNVEGDEGEGRALGLALSAAIETELIKQKRPGGLLA
mgnify:CR=1 FL=1